MVSKEGSDASRTRDSIIDSEFGKREPFHPILLTVVDIMAQVLLKVCIRNLSLAIRFRVEGCGEVNRDTEAVTDSFPEFRNKETPTVRDNRVRKTMKLPDVPNKALG
jgi:hypothetical protein